MNQIIIKTLRHFIYSILAFIGIILYTQLSPSNFKEKHIYIYSIFKYIGILYGIVRIDYDLKEYNTENREKSWWKHFKMFFVCLTVLTVPLFTIYMLYQFFIMLGFLSFTGIVYLFISMSLFLSIITILKHNYNIKNKIISIFQYVASGISGYLFLYGLYQFFIEKQEYDIMKSILFLLTPILIFGLALLKGILDQYKQLNGSNVSMNSPRTNKDGFLTTLFYTLYHGIVNVWCKINDNFETNTKNNKQNENTRWVFVGLISILLISIEFFYPEIKEKTHLLYGRNIQYTPVNIHKPSKHLLFENNQDIKDKINKGPKYTFGLSLWFYINQSTPSQNINSNHNTNVFDYNGNPKCSYNVNTKQLSFSMNKGQNSNQIIIYKTKELQLQKWNHVVCNYINGVMDIFLNNELVTSIDNNIPFINNQSALIVGETDGIPGGVKKIIYNENGFSRKQINGLYYLY